MAETLKDRLLGYARKSAKLTGVILGLVVFGIWMNIVGNPHVADTSIVLLIATGVGIYV